MEPVDTAGMLCEASLAELPEVTNIFGDQTGWRSAPQWETAWHSSALPNLPGFLEKGVQSRPNALKDKRGYYSARCYAEGHQRRHCSFLYSTHVAVPGIPPAWWFGMMFECLGDKSRRRTENNQHSYAKGALHLHSIFIHVADIRQAYQKGYSGQLRVHWNQYQALRGLSVPEGPRPFLVDARIYDRPKEQIEV